MYICEKDLEKQKVLWHGINSGYDLGNGLIAKKYNFIDKKTLEVNIQKILIANQFQGIDGLVAPVDILESENGIVGYIMEKKDGIAFSDYYNKSVDGPSLDEIVNYIVKVEKILKKCHQEEMYFPDLASGNALYNSKTKDVFIIDYDGAQIKNLETYDISSIIYDLHKELLGTKKYYKGERYNKNIDIFTLVVRFFYYATKLDIGKNLRAGFSLDEIFVLIHLDDEEVKYLIRRVFDRKADNEYIGEALEELNNNYCLTKKVLGSPRLFVRK